MKPRWKERSTLQLIAALQKVEDDWGGPEVWDNEDKKWLVVAAELPHLASDLKILENERAEISNICKDRFHELCWHFNVAVKNSTWLHPVHSCLTVEVMSALRHYALRSSPSVVSPGMALSKRVTRGIKIPYSQIPDEEYSNDSADSGISDKSTGDQLTKEDSPERQTLEAPLAPSDAKQWERPIFKITLKQRDFSVGIRTVPPAFQVIYSKDKDPIILKCIFNGKKYPVKYLPHAKVLSGGWKQFVRENSFKEGDVLVFHKLDYSSYEVSCAEL